MNSENTNGQLVDSDQLTIRDLLIKSKEWYKYILSKWLIIIVFGLAGGSIGFVYASFKKPLFSAATTFVLEDGDKGGGLGQYAGLASMAGIDLGASGGGIFQGDNILELYRSRKMIQQTLLTETMYGGKSQLLIDVYIDFNKLREKWSKRAALKDLKFNKSEVDGVSRLKDSVLGVIVSDISKGYLTVAKPDKKLSIIKVEVKSENEVFSKGFNDEIVKNVNDFYIQTKTKKSLENVDILQQKVDSVRSVMNGAIYTAAAVADATPNLNPTRQINRIAPVQKSQFSAETNKTILAELVKNLEMSKISLRKETPLIQVVDQPIYPLSKEGLGRMKGLIVGGILSGMLIIIVIVIRKSLKNIIGE